MKASFHFIVNHSPHISVIVIVIVMAEQQSVAVEESPNEKIAERLYNRIQFLKEFHHMMYRMDTETISLVVKHGTMNDVLSILHIYENTDNYKNIIKMLYVCCLEYNQPNKLAAIIEQNPEYMKSVLGISHVLRNPVEELTSKGHLLDAFYRACSTGQFDIVQWFIEKMNVHVLDKNNEMYEYDVRDLKMAVAICKENGYTEIYTYLEKW